jgi:predicted Na+-dependent transporter
MALASSFSSCSFKEEVMAHVLRPRRFFGVLGRFFAHAAAVVIGFVLMILGLGLGVTMVMLPAGLVIGLIGVALVVGGIFARIDED